MKKIVREYIVKFIILITTLNYVSSEESADIFFGVYTGYGESIHQNPVYQFKISSNKLDCVDDIKSSVSKDYCLGLRLEYVFLKKIFFSNSLIFSSNYETSQIKYRNPGDRYPSLIQDNKSPAGLEILMSSTEIEEQIEIDYINFDLLYNIKFHSILDFGISFGPFFSLPSKTFISEEYKLIEPKQATFNIIEGYKYRDRNRTVVLYEGTIYNVNPFYWGLKTNAFLEYEFFDLIKNTLEAGYTYPISYFAKDSNWKIESYYANLIISLKLIDFKKNN